jgi:glutathione synthase/RimK-type ligase-like ATP-grasp enzyme
MMDQLLYKRFRYAVRKLPFVEEIYRRFVEKQRYTVEAEKELLKTAPDLLMDWPKGIKKPCVGVVKELGESFEVYMYWPKFERFLKNNQISYEFIDIYCSDFMEEAKDFDLVLWRTLNTPSSQWEAETKIRLLEEELGIICFPSSKDVWWYENKERQYYLLKQKGLPMVETFISHNRAEALAYVENCEYPFVSKISIGSGSLGVRKIRDKRAARHLCRQVFGRGKSTYWSYLKQKDYVYFQRMVENDGVDLRVINMGDNYFGYYRHANDGDFRASGTGKVEKHQLPVAALELARQTKLALNAREMIAVDFLYDEVSGRYLIIEISIFVQTMTSIPAMEDGVPGVYRYRKGAFEFEPGRFWVQELACVELMKEWIERNQNDGNR